MTRRHLLAAGAAVPAAVRAASSFTKPVGLQMYSVRTLMPKDPRGTLAEVAKIGYSSIETGRAALPQLAPICRELKLTTPSVGVELPFITGDWDNYKPLKSSLPDGYDWARAIQECKGYGARFVGISYLSRQERSVGGLDFYRKFADQMNRAGEQAAKAGTQLIYHHHSFEFEPQGGQIPFDILVERFDRKAVRFEIDVFWMKIGGQEPVARLKQLGNRVACLHLKDIKPGTPVQHDEGKVAKEAFQEVGSGSLDFKAILKVCAGIGVEQYFVEQDWWPGSPLDSIKKSYDYLRSI